MQKKKALGIGVPNALEISFTYLVYEYGIIIDLKNQYEYRRKHLYVKDTSAFFIAIERVARVRIKATKKKWLLAWWKP